MEAAWRPTERLTEPLLAASLEEGIAAGAQADEPKTGAQQWARFEREYVSRTMAAAERPAIEPQMENASMAASMQNVRAAAESEPRLIVLILAIACASGLLTYLASVLGLAFVGMLNAETALFMGSMLILNFLIGITLAHFALTRSWKSMLRAVKELYDLSEAISIPMRKPWIPEAQLVGAREVSLLSLASARLTAAVSTLSCYVPALWLRRILEGDPTTTTPQSLYQVQVTTMFVDIANYTSLCESLSHEDLRILLGSYFEAAIWALHNFEGTVAEILGDGLLIFWNAPADVADPCGKACLGAIALQRALQVLNYSLEAQDLPRLEVRIGINTGQAYAGNIGSVQRMKFGCMGDSVITASRLEGLCKVFGVRIILSDGTRSQLPNWGFLCRPLGRVRVKGKYEIVTIYELMEPLVPSDVREALPIILGSEFKPKTGSTMVAGYTVGSPTQLPAEEQSAGGHGVFPELIFFVFSYVFWE